MYGTDTSQAGSLAATGLAVGAAGQTIAGAVIVIAGLALLTVGRVIKHRVSKAQD